MKNQFLTKATLLICLTIFAVSCDKKADTMDMGGMKITMSYSPNPAIKDSSITFNFEVMQDTMYTAVTNTSCEIIMGSSNNTMAVTEKSMGKYTGTYKYTQTGTYALHFKYMHEMVESDKDFTCIVQ